MVTKADIGHIALSDHAPILLELTISQASPRTSTWRLNKALLKDPEIAADVLTELKSYLIVNIDSVDNPATVWSAHKCFIRGILTKHGHAAKQRRAKTLSDLLVQLHTLERQLKN